jgi:hypothetical protein
MTKFGKNLVHDYYQHVTDRYDINFSTKQIVDQLSDAYAKLEGADLRACTIVANTDMFEALLVSAQEHCDPGKEINITESLETGMFYLWGAKIVRNPHLDKGLIEVNSEMEFEWAVKYKLDPYKVLPVLDIEVEF